MVKKLAEIRKKKGLNQAVIAEACGVAQSAVAMWENGAATPRVDRLIKIAEILGCSVDELLSDE